MTIRKFAKLDMIGVAPTDDLVKLARVEVRLSKMTVDEDYPGAPIARAFHRVSLFPDTDLEALLDAVNTDLSAQGYGTVDPLDWEDIKAFAARKWRPEVVAAYYAAATLDETLNFGPQIS